MKGSLVICTVVAVVGSAVPEAGARGLAVDAGVGYRSWSRGDQSLSRSFVQVVPSFTTGRVRMAAPVAIAFRGSEAPFSFGNPLAFKSDDWVNLDLELAYEIGKTRVTLAHDSLQLLSSGILPARGFGDVETDNRFFVHRSVGSLGGARLSAVGGYWGTDRWTETDHGSCRGPVIGLSVDPAGKQGLAPQGIVLVGSEAGGQFTSAQLGLRYRRATWQLDATAETRRYPAGGGALFSRNERRLHLALIKSLR
jgi:hypothetical protein